MSRQPSRFMAFINGLIIPVMATVSVLLALVVVGGRAVQGYEMRQEARAVEQRVENLKKENGQLAQELDYYRSDRYIEKVAREELGLVRPNDVAVVVVPADGKSPPSLPAVPAPAPTPAPTPTRQDIPPWQQWLSLFIGRD